MSDVIVYMSYDGADGEDNWVHWMMPDGSNKQAIVDPEELGVGTIQGVMSPDGKKILYADDDYNDIKTYDIATGEVTTLYTGEYVQTVNYNPRGTRIVFSDYNENDDLAIYIMDADGSNPTMLANPAQDDDYTLPSFNRTGDKIVFQTGWSNEVAIMNADGTGITTLTDAGTSYHPSFLPNGRILYRSQEDGGESYDIWVMNANGSNKTNLTNTPSVSEAFPTSNAAGTLIAYSNNTDILVAPFNGNSLGTPVNITEDDDDKCWRPAFGQILTSLVTAQDL